LLPILGILLLLFLAWSSMRLTDSPSYPSFRFDYLRPKKWSQPTTALRGDPLDFSIPLRFTDGVAKPPGSNYTYRIVVPKTADEDLSWMIKDIPEEFMVVYEVDNPNAKYTVPQNKGREAMVRLPREVAVLQRPNANGSSMFRYTSRT
jgi:predicted carbohydrate-binding protein with CBM5 and CBM33 domain